jgi:predicted phosphodiesterase
MRIAALSDIHGNLPALEAVLAELAGERIDLVVNLGDILAGPLWPRETAALLMQLGWPTIAGNHERQMLAARGERAPSASDAFAAQAITADQRAWLAALPAGALLEDVQLTHGSPRSDLENLLETVIGGAHPGIRAATRGEVAERLGHGPGHRSGHGLAPLVLCGHSHVPRLLSLDGTLIVNPGSVGLPAYDHDQPHEHVVETGSPHARWAIVERRAGRWQAQLRATAYDWEAAAARAEANGRGDWADALATGFVGRTERSLGQRVS